MRIALLQTDIRWKDVAANVEAARKLMEEHPADLYVLPEMWATGFDTAPDAATAAASAEALAWMHAEARGRNCCMAGSLAAPVDGGFRNRFYFVHPDGRCDFYDKRHLFGYGGEPAHYVPGRRRTVVCAGGLRLLLLTCYDLRFPVFSRNRGDYDVALYVASWPASRRAAWDVLLRARAIENQCYVCGVNRTGEDPVCRYDGGSAAIDAYGRTVADLGCGHGARVFEPDLEALRRFRAKFPVLADADDFDMDF